MYCGSPRLPSRLAAETDRKLAFLAYTSCGLVLACLRNFVSTFTPNFDSSTIGNISFTFILVISLSKYTAYNMPYPNSLLSIGTWRILGLGMATTLISLGAFSFIDPIGAANKLGIEANTPESCIAVTKTMYFLGARDFCIATTLFWLANRRQLKAVGALLCSFGFVYITDIWVAATGPRGWDTGVNTLLGGALVGSFVGLGLLQCPQ